MVLNAFGLIVATLAVTAGTCAGMGLCDFEKLNGNKAKNSCYGDKAKIRYSCPHGMSPGDCSSQVTCKDPHSQSGNQSDTCLETNGCVCPSGMLFQDGGSRAACVQPEQCPCYWHEAGGHIPANQSYVNESCTTKVSCVDNQLLHQSYICSPHANCQVQNGSGKCVCSSGFRGDGVNCVQRTAIDCYELYLNGNVNDGVTLIQPIGSSTVVSVYCQMGEGGWTVIQRRANGSTDFFLDWNEYRNGFGDKTHEFWFGNELIHLLTQQGEYELQITIRRETGEMYHANYDLFKIGPESALYQLSKLGSWSGSPDISQGYGFADHRYKRFSTRDREYEHNTVDCATTRHGGWWYGGSGCAESNLNGDYHAEFGTDPALYWYNLPPDGSMAKIVFTEMKIRPKPGTLDLS